MNNNASRFIFLVGSGDSRNRAVLIAAYRVAQIRRNRVSRSDRAKGKKNVTERC